METKTKFHEWWKKEVGYSYTEWLHNTGSIPPLEPLEAYEEGFRQGVIDAVNALVEGSDPP